MKKSILIGVLAALMLFAFTACENNATTGVEQLVVTKIEVTSEAPSLFAGEAYDEEGLTVVATRLDGTTFEVPESDYTFTKAAKVEAKDGELTTVGSVSYDGYTYGNKVKAANVEAYVYTIDKLVAEGSVATYYFIYDSAATVTSDYNASAYTVTAQALDDDDNVIYSRALNYLATEDASWTADTDSEYKVTATAPAKDEAGSGKVKFELNGALATDNASAEAAEVNALYQLDDVESVSIALKDAETEFIVGDTIASKYDMVDGTSLFTVTLNYVSGYTADSAAFTLAFTNASDVAQTTVPAGSMTVTATDTVSKLKASLTVNTTDNYIKSFTATYAADATVKGGEKLLKDLVTIMPSWAGTATPSTFEATFTVSDNDGTMPETVADGKTWAFTVTLTNAESKAEPAVLVVTAGEKTTTVEEAEAAKD